LDAVTDELPMFPLNTVLFPGMTMALHVFEDRYRALVHHLLTIPDRSQRLFGVVAIREGYEVGSHGVQSLHRVGCVAQMTTVVPADDGKFDIEIVGRDRFRLEGIDTSGSYLVGRVETMSDAADPASRPDHGGEQAARTRDTFEVYRARLSDVPVPTHAETPCSYRPARLHRYRSDRWSQRCWSASTRRTPPQRLCRPEPQR
jgi:Lon protease-like protein